MTATLPTPEDTTTESATTPAPPTTPTLTGEPASLWAGQRPSPSTAPSPSTTPQSKRKRVRHAGGERTLTDAEAAALAARMPDDPIPLDPDDLACADCGRAVSGPIDPAAITWDDPNTAELGGGALSLAVGGLSAEPLTTCPDCAARRALADDLTARLLPGGLSLAGIHYPREHAAGLVRAALTTLAALGVRTPDPDGLTREVLGIIVRRLAPHGAALGWSARFAPVRLADARPGTANPRPWAHVRESTRLALRRAYLGTMADRLSLSAPPVALVPPPVSVPSGTGRTLAVPSGCLLCGLASVSRPAVAVARAGGRANAAADVWTYRESISPESLGGRPAPVRLAGHTCPVCTEALAYVGAVGPSALERSLLVALDLAGRWNESADALAGAVGWGGLYADAIRRSTTPPEPNGTPWAHLGDLDALADRLAAGLALGGR